MTNRALCFIVTAEVFLAGFFLMSCESPMPQGIQQARLTAAQLQAHYQEDDPTAPVILVVVIVAGLNIGEYWLVASGRQVPLLKLIPRAKVPAEDLDK